MSDWPTSPLLVVVIHRLGKLWLHLITNDALLEDMSCLCMILFPVQPAYARLCWRQHQSLVFWQAVATLIHAKHPPKCLANASSSNSLLDCILRFGI